MMVLKDMLKRFSSIFDIAFLGRGFRPFFLLGAFYAAFMILAWVLIFNGIIEAPKIWSDPVLWHAHEMIFGFTTAIIVGFLLTAVANWTGGAPVRQMHLAFLALVWILGRVGFWYPFASPLVLSIIDLSFIVFVIISLGIPLIGKRNKRNFIFLGFLTLLFLCNLHMHLIAMGVMGGDSYAVAYSAVFVILMVISIVGSRVIPAFTVGALRQRGHNIVQKSQYRLDILAMLLILAMVFSTTLIGLPSAVTGSFAILSSLLHLFRMRFWHTKKALVDPLLWILHLGHFWLVIGLFTFGLYSFGIIEDKSLALHILTTGAIGTMILGMIPRVSLGHTGRKLKAGAMTIIAFYIMQFAIITRIASLVIKDENYPLWVMTSGILWSLAFIIFLVFYTKILISPRPDGGK